MNNDSNDSASRQETRSLDGRVIVIAALAMYFALLALGARFFPYSEFWRDLGVDTMHPTFADVRVMTAAFESHRAGLNVWRENPTDPWKRTFNYPRLWLGLASLGIDQGDTDAIGLGMAALFFVSALAFLRRVAARDGPYYALLLCSPAAMLAVERANIDIVMFALLAAALLVLRRPGRGGHAVSYGLVLVAAVLKFFPIFACSIAFARDRKIFQRLAALTAALFGGYLIFTFDDLSLISASTPRGITNAYGSGVLTSCFARMLIQMHVIEFEPQLYRQIMVLSTGMVLALAGAVYLRARQSAGRSVMAEENESFSLGAFRAGACIFLGTFALGNNWDYRLVFLLFAVPQCLRWRRGGGGERRVANLSLWLIALTMNWQFFSSDSAIRFVLVNEVINWALVACLFYLFLLSLPDWAKTLLKLPQENAAA